MEWNRSRSVRIGATALGLAAALTTAGPAVARPAAPAASGCVVVLECPGVTQQVVPDAKGAFVFKDVPAGSCQVSVVAAEPADLVAPRDAASGLPTGKRMHKPMSFQMVLDRESAAAARATASEDPSKPVTVVVQQKQRELKGHVTLIK